MKPSEKSKVIIVLGMHRSGTSLLTGILNLLGVHLGSDLFSPTEDNKTGCWENKKIVQLNEEILSTLGFSYDDPRPLPNKWWENNELIKYKQDLIELITKEFVQHSLCAIKDPRLCRLIPFWHFVLEELNIEPYYILIARNPIEVVNSLSKRDGIDQARSSLLWLRHNLEAELFTRGKKRLFVTYESILDNWKYFIKRISNSFDINLSPFSETVEYKISKLINPSLRNHISSTNEISSFNHMNEWLISTYSFFYKSILTSEPINYQELDVIFKVLNIMDSFIWHITQEKINKQTQLLIEQVKQIEYQKEQILNSLSWKITAPLRKIKQLLNSQN